MATPDGIRLDCPRALTRTLADRLGFYKLRAKVSVEDLSGTLAVTAAWAAMLSPLARGGATRACRPSACAPS